MCNLPTLHFRRIRGDMNRLKYLRY